MSDTSHSKPQLSHISTFLETAVDRIDTLFQSDNMITGIPTGFIDIDRMTSGLQPADLVIIGARPSMGKTTFALNIAVHAAVKRRTTVALFSLDLPGVQLVTRILSSLGHIDLSHLCTGQLDDHD